MKKAIAYLRVSTMKQVDDGSSLENQESRIRAYCLFNNLDLSEVIIDHGQSGGKDDRSGFIRVVDMIKSKEIDCVVVYSLSRFTRKIRTLLEVSELIKNNGIALHSLSEKIDTSTAVGELFFNIIGSINQFDSSQKGEIIRDVKKHNKKELRTYSSPVYGFENDKVNHKLIPIESEMKIVNRIYEMYSNNWPLNKIATTLNNENIPTKNNATWYACTIKKIVNNTVYA